MIWDGSPGEIERWLDRVFSGKEQSKFEIEIGEIEG